MQDHERIEGIILILDRIKDNEESFKLTHKQIRSYSRSLLVLADTIYLESKLKLELLLLIELLSKGGIPHYDRSFLASQAIEVLKKQVIINNKSTNDESF
jgi:hypothetical protein